MDLSFSKSGKFYVAEATVQGDFCVHVELNQRDFISVDIATGTGDYINGKYTIVADRMERDFDGIVYPKKVRVRSYSQPKLGYIIEA